MFELRRQSEPFDLLIIQCLPSESMGPAYPKRHTPSKLDPFAEVLSWWLEREASRGRKHRRNLRQL